MEKSRLLGAAGLLLFAAGFLIGLSHSGGTADMNGDASDSALKMKQYGESESDSRAGNTRSALRQDDVMQGGYGQLLEMVEKGVLRLDDVGIHGQTFLPQKNVAEFFELSEQQIDEMKRIGQERERKRQERELEMAKVIEVSDEGMVVDLPADPDFATSEAAGFVEDLRRSFAPDVVALLQPSIESIYRDSSYPRHVRLKVFRPLSSELEAAIGASELPEDEWRHEMGVNTNEDGSYMTDGNGISLGGGSSHSGGFYPNDPDRREFEPRYYDLWKKVTGRE